MILAGAICVGYACTDEYHQSLVSGRAASSRDVMIDSIGIFFGVILTRLIGWSGRMAITGPAYERRQKKQQKALDAREEELRAEERHTGPGCAGKKDAISRAFLSDDLLRTLS